MVYGHSGAYTATVLVGVKPAISKKPITTHHILALTVHTEGPAAAHIDKALAGLLSATCELLNAYAPKVLPHQRSIHGGGAFDEDMISQVLVGAGKCNGK